MFETKNKSTKKITLAVILVLAGVFGYITWYKAFRVVPQPEFASGDKRYMYGSLGAEDNVGLPYWIFLVLPRMFPEYLPGPGGYISGNSLGTGRRNACWIFQKNNRFSARHQYLRGMSYGQLPRKSGFQPDIRTNRARPHRQCAGLLSLLK